MKIETKILTLCSSTEVWERYGFYAIQSLLALILSLHFSLDDSAVFALTGAFTALTYISPIIGGWIADRYIGQRHSIALGALLLSISYTLIMFCSNIQSLSFALSITVMGTGLLKPNTSAWLGAPYTDLNKKNRAFIFFYLTITTGIILGSSLPTALMHHYGWKTCFASASIALAIALTIFLSYAYRQEFKTFDAPKIYTSPIDCFKTSAIVITSVYIFRLVLTNTNFSFIFFILILISAIGTMLNIARKEDINQKRKTQALSLLMIISTFFWSFYFQIFTEITLYIDRLVRPRLLGLHATPPIYVAIESAGMLVVGAIYLLSRRKKAPPPVTIISISFKFLSALFLMLTAYGIILMSLYLHLGATQLISPWPIVCAFLTISLAELLLSPTGLAAVTTLARPQVVGTVMGVFFISLGFGGFLSGILARLSSIHHASNILEIQQLYWHGLSTTTLILCITCLISIIIHYMIRRITAHTTQI